MLLVNDKVISPDLLIVGAGPAGSAAAWHAAKLGMEALLVDQATFPRDKTCGDGLTPRAIHQLEAIGVDVTSHYQSRGLKLHGFGGSVEAPWPDSSFGNVGSAMPRTKLDNLLLEHALGMDGARFLGGVGARAVELDGAIRSVELSDGTRVLPKFVIVADGVRSTFGKQLGRTWHKGEVFGIAARSYCETPFSDEPWIHSHLELRDAENTIQPGYGWIFPLGDGRANVGCGALSTDNRPAKVNTKKLLHLYAQQQREAWHFGQPEGVASALLPMGGAVSGVAGPNWMLIGDAAACVNPLNGEGIDYGLETAAMAVGALDEGKDFTLLWPEMLRHEYGEAFLLARTLARALTYPQFLPLTGPLALRKPMGKIVMPAAARLMGNLVVEEDRDLVARVWRAASGASMRMRGSRVLWG
ncbi:geranylgeranyl reductase family protein [Corynebacterium gerontici]|uniref:Oxidoreductase n=1 Tax=Corynebacterium gerontici TaxID=2079234 RepID=A0A3G6J2E8_9CORY|nr:geranylgeranyl reductase family protein [Corynebacterium gerontici]AZA12197.1 Putative oxidoreductase [Corynebacterium gerontici]